MMTRITRVSFLLTGLWALAATAGAQQRLMTVDDVPLLNDLGQPQFSPAGESVAFTLTRWIRKEHRQVAHIYRVSSHGGELVQLSDGPGGEWRPSWSPDGSRIAYLADRGSGFQVWAIPAQGGEEERITDQAGGVREFAWSPDGKRIAYITLEPAGGTGRGEGRQPASAPLAVGASFYQSQLWVVDADSGERQPLAGGDGSYLYAPSWSPDGRWLAYTVRAAGLPGGPFADRSEKRESEIWLVPAQGGTPRQVTFQNGIASFPLFSPEGDRIAYLFKEASGWRAKRDLMAVPAQGGTPRRLTRGFPESVSMNFAWSQDGKQVYFGAYVGVHADVFAASLESVEIRRVTGPGRVLSAFDIDSRRGLIAYLASGPSTPEELYIAPIGDPRRARKLTECNSALRQFRFAKSQVVRWRAKDGKRLEGILIRPDAPAGGPLPLVVEVHGGPYGKHLLEFDPYAQVTAASGYRVLRPNLRGSVGYGPAFKAASVGNWGGEDFQDLLAGASRFSGEGSGEPAKAAIVGHSYGGFLALWAITQSDRFSAAIALAGVSDWASLFGQTDLPALIEEGFCGPPWAARDLYRSRSPIEHVAGVRTPLLLIHGEKDRRIPIGQSAQFFRALRKLGREVVFLRYAEEGHDLSQPKHALDLAARQISWLDRHLK